MGFFGWLFDVVRDLALLAAAVGIAKWAWDRHTDAPRRKDAARLAMLEAERLRTDLRQSAARVEALLAEIAANVRERVAAQRDKAALEAAKVLVHRLLQATTDPYLSFAELEMACAKGAETSAAGTALAGDALRRVLIELVADGAVTQLDRDRYFIASDFETDESDGA